MELGESMEDSVKRAVELCRCAGIGNAGLDVVRSSELYAYCEKSDDKKKLDVRYYGLLPEVDMEELLDRALANESAANKDFWTQLKTDHRVTKTTARHDRTSKQYRHRTRTLNLYLKAH